MKFLAKLMAVALAMAATTSAAAIPQDSEVETAAAGGVKGKPISLGQCKQPIIRQEWRTLSATQKSSFLNAVNCLHSAAPKNPAVAAGSASRFEDFVAEHKIQTDYIHQVGHFLPWHRLLLHEFEKALRNECGYTGALPYWDYSLDSNDISLSPVFSGTDGFGGDGVLPENPEPFVGYCIGDGPFANWTINIAEGPIAEAGPRCLTRSLVPFFGQGWLTPAVEAGIKSKTNFGDMVFTLEGEPTFEELGMHGAGHWGIGGSAANVYTSNSDPLFYLHHANLDRIWAEWQNADLSSRLWDIDGSIIPRHPDVFLGDYSNLSSGNVTLDFLINLGNLGGPSSFLKVQQIMDTKGGRPHGAHPSQKGPLCYEYAASPSAAL